MAVSTTFKDILFCLESGNNPVTKLYVKTFFNLKELNNLKIVYLEEFKDSDGYEINKKWLFDIVNERIKDLTK